MDSLPPKKDLLCSSVSQRRARVPRCSHEICICLYRSGWSHAETCKADIGRLTDLQADTKHTYVMRLGNRTCTTIWAGHEGQGNLEQVATRRARDWWITNGLGMRGFLVSEALENVWLHTLQALCLHIARLGQGRIGPASCCAYVAFCGSSQH